jgi:hypothetical protein
MMKAKPKGRGNPYDKNGKPKKVPGRISGVAGKPPTRVKPISPGGAAKPGAGSKRKPPTRVRPVVGGPKKPGTGSKRKPVKGRRTFKRI